MKKLLHLFDSEEGVTSIEYALIASLLAVVIVVAVKTAGGSLNIFYSMVASKLVGIVNSL